MIRGRCWQLLIVLFIILGLLPCSEAGEPTEELKETTDRIIAILTDPSFKGPDKTSERNKRIRRVVDERFDWVEMSRRTLARHWARRTAEEKREFITLFGKLLERTYRDKVDDYSGEKVVFEDEVIDGEYGLVKSKIMTSKAKEVEVAYRVKKKGDKWYVYDVVIEGVSLINNYRTQFNSILVRSSFKDLMEKLRTKVEKE